MLQAFSSNAITLSAYDVCMLIDDKSIGIAAQLPRCCTSPPCRTSSCAARVRSDQHGTPRYPLVALGTCRVARLLFQKAARGCPRRFSSPAPANRPSGIPHSVLRLTQACPSSSLIESKQLESCRDGPCPPFFLDAVPLSKCAKSTLLLATNS